MEFWGEGDGERNWGMSVGCCCKCILLKSALFHYRTAKSRKVNHTLFFHISPIACGVINKFSLNEKDF